MHRPEQPVAAAVTGEHPTGPIRPVGGRSEAQHDDPRRGITEAGDRSTPVVLVTKRRSLVPRDLSHATRPDGDMFDSS